MDYVERPNGAMFPRITIRKFKSASKGKRNPKYAREINSNPRIEFPSWGNCCGNSGQILNGICRRSTHGSGVGELPTKYRDDYDSFGKRQMLMNMLLVMDILKCSGYKTKARKNKGINNIRYMKWGNSSSEEQKERDQETLRNSYETSKKSQRDLQRNCTFTDSWGNDWDVRCGH